MPKQSTQTRDFILQAVLYKSSSCAFFQGYKLVQKLILQLFGRCSPSFHWWGVLGNGTPRWAHVANSVTPPTGSLYFPRNPCHRTCSDKQAEFPKTVILSDCQTWDNLERLISKFYMQEHNAWSSTWMGEFCGLNYFINFKIWHTAILKRLKILLQLVIKDIQCYNAIIVH